MKTKKTFILDPFRTVKSKQETTFLLFSLFSASTVLVITFWSFTVFQYRTGLPQVKQSLISSITNLLYELPQRLLNDLRLRILGN